MYNKYEIDEGDWRMGQEEAIKPTGGAIQSQAEVVRPVNEKTNNSSKAQAQIVIPENEKTISSYNINPIIFRP